MKKTLKITGLDCPVCAEALEGDICKIRGVKWASVDYVSQTICLETENEDVVARVIKKANKFEQVRVLEGDRYALNKNSHSKEWLQIILSALFFIGGLLLSWLSENRAPRIVVYCCFGVAYFAVGYPVLISTAKNVSKGRVFDENFLMTLASIGAVALGEIAEGVLVMLLYQLGELLQSIAVGSSRRSVAELMELKSESATLLVNGETKAVNPEEIEIGDVILIKAGEKVPVDGVLLSERATLDTKSLTGESEYKIVKTQEEILSGSINVGGMYEMKATRRYEDSAVGKILNLVENASAGKATPEKFITKFAKVYTPIVCCFALAMAIIAPLLNGLIVENKFCFVGFPRWLQSALTFLVISCPCALIISVPLTYFSGIGACAKNGILVKGATYLDVLARAKIVAFDKTGTLTEGDFRIQGVYPAEGVTEVELLETVASVEYGSAHPIAGAFEGHNRKYIFDSIEERAGEGVIASLNGEKFLVGNEKLFLSEKISMQTIDTAYTAVYVARAGQYLGAIEVGDKLRADAKPSLSALKKQGISRLVMLTGDGKNRAEKIANELGMYEVKSELLPDDKLTEAEKLKGEGTLVYVGDGVNDAPVMSVADCAVSMGKLGSAAAVEASDVVLISDCLSEIPKGLKIAKKTRAIVLENIWFSIVMKVAFMVLGACGVLQLWLAVFADVGIMLLAVLNSFRVRFLGSKMLK